MKQHNTVPSTEAAAQEHLVEMAFVPFASVPSPTEVGAFTERFVLPTLEACEGLRESGRIAAGGPLLGATGFAFIARTGTAEELEEMLGALPLWPRAQTRIVPLATFAARAGTVRRRVAQLAAPARPVEAAGATGAQA